MRERTVIRWLWVIGVSWLSLVAAAPHVLPKREKPKFIDPVIWRVPHTGGNPQLMPDI